MRQIANFVTKTQRELTVLCELFRIWILMNAIDCWNRRLFHFAGHRFVCGQHEFFNQLMRFIVLDALQSCWLALFIDPDFYLWKIEIQRAVFESLPPQQRGEFPGDMKPFTQLVAGRRHQNRVCFFVREPERTANDASRKPRAFGHAAFVELNEYGMCEPIDSRIEAANAVAQPLRQHWDHAIGKIHAVAASARFPIQRAAALYVSSNIGDVHAELPPAVWKLRHVNSVVEIARIIGVNGNDELVAQIFASGESLCVDRFGNALRLLGDVSWKLRWQMILPED